MTRTTLALGSALLLAGGLAFAAPLSASAHNVVIDSSPKEGQVLNQLPDSFFVTTNEPMFELDGSNGFAIQIRDADGRYYGDGCVTVSGSTLSAVPALGDPGEYTMLYQAVSEDGHTIDGEIGFTWTPLGTVGKVSPALDAPPVCGESPAPTPVATVPAEDPGEAVGDPAPSGIELPTVLWIAGGLVAVGVLIAIAILIAGRRRRA